MSGVTAATSGINELTLDASKPVTYSNTVLSQAEGVYTDFYTINFARLICANLTVDGHGQRLFNSCLTNLPVYRSADDRLQFGWADRNLWRNIGVQLYEYEHLVLGSALSECFAEWYGASVLLALGEYFATDDTPNPHLSSWRGFVRASNGIVSLSEFPLLVDDRIRCNPYRTKNIAEAHHDTNMGSSVSPEHFAKALHSIALLKKGERKELSLAGGDVLGWFAAYATLFLELHVALVDQDGKEHYKSPHNGKSTLKLIFVPLGSEPRDKGSDTIWLNQPQPDEAVMRPSSFVVTGRVTGDAAFNKVFGTAFHRLDQSEAKHFGNALGGAARRFGVAAKDETSSHKLVSAENRANPRSWGAGLVQVWIDWFPELRHLQGRMDRAQKEDATGAEKLCMSAINHLEPLCGCYICMAATATDGKPGKMPANNFCTPTLMETIILLGLTLSRVALATHLYPSRVGILALYEIQVQKRLQIRTLAEQGVSRGEVLFHGDWNAGISKRLLSVVTLFTGIRPTEDIPENLIAISHEGICAYVMKLERGDAGKAREDDKVIRVVSGSVHYQQKIFSRVCMGPPQSVNSLEEGWQGIKCEHWKEKLYVK